MKKTLDTQDGFTILELVIVMTGVTILVAVVFYFWG